MRRACGAKENARGDTLSGESRMEINMENAVWSVTAERSVTKCGTGKKMVEGAFDVQNTHGGSGDRARVTGNRGECSEHSRRCGERSRSTEDRNRARREGKVRKAMGNAE